MAVSIIAIIPTEWLHPDHKDDVIMTILALPVDPEDRKRLILEWCRLVGVVLTEDIVKAVRGK